jgi:hypothetical protein
MKKIDGLIPYLKEVKTGGHRAFPQKEELKENGNVQKLEHLLEMCSVCV